MILRHDSRESGIEFAVGCFLLALGIGLLIPRPGLGLYSLLRAGGDSHLWALLLLSSALWLILGSFKPNAAVRLGATIFAMLCWTMLGFKFIEGGLWGATMQAIVAIFLLNACIFRLWRYMRGEDRHG